MSDNIIKDDSWEKLPDNALDSEKVSRPSLTYWQDAWRRLSRDKVSIIALLTLIVIILLCIFVPMMWKFDHTNQKLELSGIPPILDVYDIGLSDKYLYVTKEYRAILVSKDGEIIGPADIINNDQINQKIHYNIEGIDVISDYGIYVAAKREYLKLEKKVQAEISKLVKGDLENKEDLIAKQNKILMDAEHSLNNTNKSEVIINNTIKKQTDKTLRNKTYIWGSDSLGRDLFARVIYGGRISLIIGIVVAIFNFIIGVIYGGYSGYKGGKVDNVMMRIVDTINSIPMLLYVILMMVIFKPGTSTIILAMVISSWVRMARQVRGQMLTLKEQEFVLAARTLGASSSRIMLRHLIPNAMGPIMVNLTMQIPSAIFTESFLSFIGIGIAPPEASWGSLANDALPGLFLYPYQMFYPSLMMCITLLAFNLLGDGLRDALDPRLRK